jgi:predicted nucleotidyltransferase
MDTITVTERTGRKVRIPRDAIWRLEATTIFVSGPREPHRTSITFHRFPRLRRGFFIRYMAFLEAVRRMTTDLDHRLSCSIDVQESYQELRDLMSPKSETNPETI